MHNCRRSGGLTADPQAHRARATSPGPRLVACTPTDPRSRCPTTSSDRVPRRTRWGAMSVPRPMMPTTEAANGDALRGQDLPAQPRDHLQHHRRLRRTCRRNQSPSPANLLAQAFSGGAAYLHTSSPPSPPPTPPSATRDRERAIMRRLRQAHRVSPVGYADAGGDVDEMSTRRR